MGLVVILLAVASGQLAEPAIICDKDSDCFYIPAAVESLPPGTRVPALVILHCVGAKPIDVDTCRQIGDSLGWILASCHRSRNHRDTDSNDLDIVRTIRKLHAHPRVDSHHIFLFGFSGQGVQALATMFLHPELVRGTVTTCAHRAALPLAIWDRLADNCAYLITRARDWNRQDNELMYQLFNFYRLRAQLVVTPGEHNPGSWREILAGCRWLDKNGR